MLYYDNYDMLYSAQPGRTGSRAGSQVGNGFLRRLAE